MSGKRVFTVLALYYSVVFMAGSLINSYTNIYFASINLTYSQIGFLNSMGAFISIVSQPIWGTLSDNSRNKNNILKIMLFGALITIGLIPLAGEKFLIILTAVMIFNFFHKAMSPINDTIAIDLSKKHRFKFSNIRLIGSLGFAMMTAVGGKIVAKNVMYIFYISFVCFIVSFVISFFIPKVKGFRESKNKKKFTELFRDKRLISIYFYVFILSTTNAYFKSFHAIYSQELGISLSVVGIGIMLGSLSQFPVMFVFNKAYKRFGLVNLMTLAGVAYAIRWIFYGTILSQGNILFIWLIHGLNYMLLYLCLVDYIQTYIPKELYTRGQVMNQLILFGFSSVTGSFLGGFLTKYIDAGNLFIINGVICFLAACTFNIVAKKYFVIKECEVLE